MPTTDELIQQSIDLARNGDRAGARQVLANLVRSDANNPRAWYLLSQLVDTTDQVRFCLNKVLELDPQNGKARQRLMDLDAGIYVPGQPPPPPAAPPATPPSSPGLQSTGDFWTSPSVPPVAPASSYTPPVIPGVPVEPASGYMPPAIPGFTPEPAGSGYTPPTIPGIEATPAGAGYTPPSVPGFEQPSAPPPSGAPRKLEKPPRKEKRDNFGLVFWLVSGSVLLCILCCLAVWGLQVAGTSWLSNLMTQSTSGQEIPAKSSYRVTYRLEGQAGTVLAQYVTGSGQTMQKQVGLPWSTTTTMPAGSLPLVSGTTMNNDTTITCTILVDGIEFKSMTMRGDSVTAMCMGILTGQ